MSDDCSQLTSMALIKAFRETDIKQALSSYRNSKNNTAMKRIFCTMKNELT